MRETSPFFGKSAMLNSVPKVKGVLVQVRSAWHAHFTARVARAAHALASPARLRRHARTATEHHVQANQLGALRASHHDPTTHLH